MTKTKDLYNIQKAMQRLAWRFTSEKSFKPNENDINSLNVVVDWVNRQVDEKINNNQLFAKLYIYFLNQTIRHYESTFFNDIPQKELSRMLDLPLANYYDAFHKELHSNLISKAILKENVDLKDLQEFYSIDFVSSKLRDMVNESLNRFS